MKIQFNDYTVQQVALFANGVSIIEHLGRFLVTKEYKGVYKVFFNTSRFEQDLSYSSKH